VYVLALVACHVLFSYKWWHLIADYGLKMNSHPDIIFKLCVVSANEADLKQATSRAWQQYALEKAHTHPQLSPPDNDAGSTCWANPFESEGAGADAGDARLWFRVRADTLYYANYYGSEIGDPYDKDSIINRLKFIYKSKLQPKIEYELGAKIGIVEANV
jgi:hypothetical protein